MDRKRIPTEIETRVLLKGARRCALCFHLSADLSEKEGQIAHLDQDPSNYSDDNLAFLCMRHHTLFDSKTSQHKNYTLHEVKVMREALYLSIRNKEHAFGVAANIKVSQRLGQLSDPFFDQRRALPENLLLTKIRSLPQWRVCICPDRFMEAQFQNLDQCERL